MYVRAVLISVYKTVSITVFCKKLINIFNVPLLKFILTNLAFFGLKNIGKRNR